MIKKHKYLIFILFVSFLPVVPFFLSQNLLHTHDGLVHLPRLAAYYKALVDGHFPVRFAGFLNYGFGLPLFNFIYQFPYMVGSLLLFAGFSLVNAFKLSLVLSFILSGAFMYLFGKEYFNDARKGILLAVFYQFAPFRMVELLVRGSYGEVYAYTFLPLVLYGIVILQKKKIVSGTVLTAISTALLIISHNSVSLLFFGVAVLFVVITSPNLKTIIRAFTSLVLGLLISAFYWMPAILEHKYTYGNLFMKDIYKEHFVPFQNLFIPNFTNSPLLQTEGISTYIGFFQTIALFLAVILLIFRKIEDIHTRRIFYFSFILLGISAFFILPVSSPIWGSTVSSFLRQFQFPWRFLSLVVLATSFLAVSFPLIDRRFRQRWTFAGLLCFTIVASAFYWKASLGYIKVNENYYWNFPLNTTYYGETDVIWSAGPAKGYPKNKIELIGGEGEIKNVIVKNHYQRFETNGKNELSLLSNSTYFPGWKAYVDGRQTPIQFQDPNNRGLLVFSVPSGKHSVLVRFEENKLRIIADLLSIAGILVLIPAAYIIKAKYAN